MAIVGKLGRELVGDKSFAGDHQFACKAACSLKGSSTVCMPVVCSLSSMMLAV